MAKLLAVIAFLAVGIGGWYKLQCCKSPSPPVLSTDEWWGPNELKGKLDNSIRPFNVKFDAEMVKDLKYRLKNHRTFAPPLEGVGFRYGFNSKTLDSWVQYWAEKYNFAEREKYLNQFPQFKTYIQGLDIHFIRVKPQVPAGVKVLPLLLLHGWPGSVVEFYQAIPLLTKPRDGFAFEVIVPSLPGFGFSSGAVRPGLASVQMGIVFRNLMHRLGHKKFYLQGGDAGAEIANNLATVFPEDILGLHVNFAYIQTPCNMLKTFIGAYFPSLVVEPHLADRMYPLSNFFAYVLEEFGYFHLQATKPDTVGASLTDSPSGLLAYILEKFSTWTRLEHRSKDDGALEFRYTKDQLIDNLMVYWSSNSITTSMRLYSEHMSNKNRGLNLDGIPTPTPTWVMQAKNELYYQPPSFLRAKYTNLVNNTVLDDGGHFIAFELPEVFTDDLFRAVKAFQEWNVKNVKTEL